ncbi:TetR/AcrR family transcriptional regulator [Patulibacter sp.]|uniref:TetR/AcrR family transcriptional regulator n=1 Tax=Patulibacter sp. TaxID=1912859 RepID=UPI00271783F2|nr:TetR/AcrR family transcriptional regulator [Patulibacter sp.]MDO9406941.1 helix-turn-helix domain-containing protein [Patulibacter sp.]
MVRADARRNAERLRAAAQEVFAEQGLGASLEAIAARAGVSIGTLYNRFGSREGLIDGAMTGLLREQVDSIAARAEACVDPWDRLESHLHGLVEMQILTPALAQSIAQAPPGSALAQECTTAMNGVGAALADAIDAGSARPDAHIDDVAALLVANVAVLSTLGAESARRLSTIVLAGLRR